MKKKTPHTSTDLKPLTKPDSWVEWVKGEALMQFPGKKEWRERLVYTLLIWAHEETALELMEFCAQYKIARTTLYKWGQRYPDIKRGLDLAKNIIGGRRRVGAIKKVYDKEAAYRDMHLYDSDWGPLVNEYWQRLKTSEPEKNQTINLILPDSDLITQKKKE